MATMLNTTRLTIRNFQAKDLDALHAMIVQYQTSAMAAYDQPWPTSREALQGVVAWFAGGDAYLAVHLKDTDQFIGFVALSPEPDENRRSFNIGYVFDAGFHGKGYATEACRALLHHAFDTLQADSVVSGTAAVNAPSRRLLEKLGFKKTGEVTVSFRTGEDGNPIEFTGYDYILSKADWSNASCSPD